MQEYFWPILAFLILITIALSGGAKNYQTNVQSNGNQQVTNQNSSNNSGASNGNQSGNSGNTSTSQNTKTPNVLRMSWGYYGNTDVNQEFIEIDADSNNSSPVDISGDTLVSTSTNIRVTIPKSVQLFYLNEPNTAEDVVLSPGEHAYILTSRSPIGQGFRANKCSGYLNQSNTFIPGLYTSCPAPRDENLSSIPRTVVNNNCFDLINGLSSCQTYTGTPLTNAYSYECQEFVDTKLNYQSCADTHKNDADFWSPKVWYVYLQHTSTLWQSERETVLLEDRAGKTLAKLSR